MLHRLVSLLAAASICLAASIPIPGRGLRASEPYGAKGLPTFDDLKSIPVSPMLWAFTLRGSQTLDGFGLILASRQKFLHGAPTGETPVRYRLKTSEYFNSVTLCSGVKDGATHIFYAEARSNIGTKIRTGTKTKDCKIITAPKDYAIVGSYGRLGKDVEQLGFYFARAKKAPPP